MLLLQAYSIVDPDGSRILLGDDLGLLYLLVLKHDDTRVLGIKLQNLGTISAPSTISYLDNGVVFIGSVFGDSQLIKLHAQPIDPSDPEHFVEVLDTFTKLGPIVDFCAMDLDRQGQVQVIIFIINYNHHYNHQLANALLFISFVSCLQPHASQKTWRLQTL